MAENKWFDFFNFKNYHAPAINDKNLNMLQERINKALEDVYQKASSTVPKIDIAVVDALPTENISTTTVYLVKSADSTTLFSEYMYVGGEWIYLGSQEFDASQFVTESELQEAVFDLTERIDGIVLRIEKLEKENAEQQEELEALWNDFKPNTVNGESAIVSDGVKGSKVEVIGDGNSYQETTEGYNLLDLVDSNVTSNGITTIVENETMAFSGKATASWCNLTPASNKIKISLKANTKYTFVRNQSLPLHVVCRIYFEDGTYEGVTIDQNQTYKEFTPTNDVVECYLYISGGMVVDTSYTYTNLKYMIYVGSYDSNKTFEPYTNGASPNTEYEQPIEVITECSLVQRGKNCFNKDVSNIYATTNIIEEKIENGIKLSGKDANSVSQYAVYPIGKLKNFIGKNVTISFDYKATNTNITDKDTFLLFCDKDGSNRVALAFNNIVGTSGKYFAIAHNLFEGLDDGQKAKYDEDDVIAVRLYASGSTNTGIPSVEYTNIQVEFGETVTEYEQGHYEVHSIDLAGNSIAKVGEIKDLLNIGVDGSVKIGDKVIKRYVFTGDENWVLTTSWVSNVTNVFYANLDINAKFEDFIDVYQKSNYFEGVSRNTAMNTDKELICYSGATKGEITAITIRANKNVAPTVNDFKAWLKEKYNSGNPVYMDYQLQNPETINLPSIEPIKLFNGTNVFELVTNLGTTLSVTYKVSNNSRLEDLEKALLS